MHYFYFIRKFISILIIIFCFGPAIAQSTDQNYPVTAQAFVVAQPGKKLSAYFSSTQALTVSLLLKDLTKTSIDVYLRWSIDGPGVRIASVDGYIPPQHFNLQRGMLQRFSGLDLQSMYFRQDVMEAQGLTGPPTRASLPEGFYTFRVQALEAGTGREVSNLGETYFSITSPLPPVINIPFNGATLAAAGSTNGSLSLSKGLVEIQWMPRHYKLPGNITTYDLKVCKIPDGYEPQEALDACVNPIIDDRGNPGTFYPSNTGIGNSIIGAFERGARYAVRVTVHEFDQNSDEVVFANEGRSEVVWFTYGSPCISPESFTINEVGTRRVQLSWTSQADNKDYKAHYRLAGSASWTTQNVTGIRTTVSGLSQGKYEFAVQSSCTDVFPANIQAFELSDDEQDDMIPTLANPLNTIVTVSGIGIPYVIDSLHSVLDKIKIPCASQISTYESCEADLPVVSPTGTKALATLSPGNVLSVYDMTVIVTSASNRAGGFSGTGLARLPFMENTMVSVEFEGVQAWAPQEPGVPGGCVYEIKGYFRTKALSAEELARQQAGLIATLSNPKDSTAFTGTLSDALKMYDECVTVTDLSRYTAAVLQGSQTIAKALDEVVDEYSDPRLVYISTQLDSLMQVLQTNDSLMKATAAVIRIDNLTGIYTDLFQKLEELKNEGKPDENNPVYAISNVQVSNIDDKSARISWQAEGPVSRYVVEYRDTDGGTLQETLTGTQLNLLRLRTGMEYRYRILAYHGDELVASYGEDVFKTMGKFVPVPENLAYTAAGLNGVNISWDKNTDHRSYKLIYIDQFGKERTLYPTINSTRIEGLVRDQKYAYRILAVGDDGLESEVVNSEFNIGTVCETRAYAAKPQIIQGEQVQLWLAGCLDEDGRNAPAEWTDGENIFPRRVIYVTPQKTTTYVATCLLTRQLPNGQTEPVHCPAEVTVIVDKKCEGVTVSATPETIRDGEAVLLTGSGCSGLHLWSDTYPVNTVLSTAKNFISYPSNGEKIYTLACIDNNGGTCIQQSKKVTVACSFELAVRTHNEGTQNEFNRSNTGVIFVEGIGCKNNEIEWERIGGKGKIFQKIKVYPWGSNGIAYYPVEMGFTVNATCKSSGCKATTGFISRPPTDREGENCNNYGAHFFNENGGRKNDLNRITIEQESAQTITLKLDGAPNYKWDDNRSTDKVRTLSMPQTTTVYSASTDRGCRTSLGYQPKRLSSGDQIIPCTPFTLSGPTQIEIPESATSVKAQLIATGCTNGLENAAIIWKREGVQFSSGLQETATVTFQETDKNKTHNFSATCSLTGETKTIAIKVIKEVPAPRAPQHPCDFYLYTNKGQYYDTFLESNSETVEVFTWGMGSQIQAFLQNDNNSIISGGPNVSYKNGEAIIKFTLHIAKRGSFALKVSNWVGGTFCDKWIYINVDNNRGFNADYVPATFNYPVTPTTKNCEKYRGSSEIAITRDAYKQSLYNLQHSALKDFGALSLYVGGQTVFYPGVTIPDKLALVDKVCNVSKGTSQWYSNAGMTTRLNDFITISGYSAAIVDNPDFENSRTYYTRCTFRNGSYCDKTVVVNPRMSSNGRLSAPETETSVSETEANCTFSKQKATDILITDLLCQKLNLLPGKEREKLLALREALLAQQVTLATITDAMVADLAAGKCSEVVKALTANITGSESVDIILTELLNKQNADRILDQVLDKISDTSTDTCTPPPFDLEESSFAGGRVSANVIDYNRYFIAPDGRAVKLPEGAQPKFYNFGYRWGAPPKGTLQGFVLANGEQYFADITNSPNKFNGYIQVKDPVCDPKVHYNGNLYETPAAGSPVYYLEPYNTNGDCGYNWIEANYTFSPTNDGSLKQIVPVPTGSFTNLTRFTGCLEETDWVTGADGIRRKTITDAGSRFLLEDKNGDITVTGEWKKFDKCLECQQIAEDALQSALTKARKKHGKLNENTNVVDGIEMPYGPAGMVKYTDMKIGDIIKNMAETYNSLLEKAKVPAEAWEPGKRFYVRDETAVISGAIDQSLEELKETADLVGLGLTLVSDPEGAYEQLKSFGQQMSWEKAGQIGVEVARGAVFADEFEKGGKYALHGTGRAGVVIAKAIATGGLLAIIKDAPNALKKKLDDIAALLGKLKSMLKDASLSDVLEKDLANDDLFKILDADNALVESWEVLKDYGDLRKVPANLAKVKGILAKGHISFDDFQTMLSVNKGLGARASDLANFLDDLDHLALYKGQSGFSSIVSGLKADWFNGAGADGANWVIAGLRKEGIDVFPPGSTSFEISISSISRRYDAVVEGALTINGQPVRRFFEFKSYGNVPPTNFAEQFLKDLNNPEIIDHNQLRWLFDAAKNPVNFEENMKAAIDGLDITDELARKFGLPEAGDLKTKLKNEFNTIFILK